MATRDAGEVLGPLVQHVQIVQPFLAAEAAWTSRRAAQCSASVRMTSGSPGRLAAAPGGPSLRLSAGFGTWLGEGRGAAGAVGAVSAAAPAPGTVTPPTAESQRRGCPELTGQPRLCSHSWEAALGPTGLWWDPWGRGGTHRTAVGPTEPWWDPRGHLRLPIASPHPQPAHGRVTPGTGRESTDTANHVQAGLVAGTRRPPRNTEAPNKAADIKGGKKKSILQCNRLCPSARGSPNSPAQRRACLGASPGGGSAPSVTNAKGPLRGRRLPSPPITPSCTMGTSHSVPASRGNSPSRLPPSRRSRPGAHLRRRGGRELPGHPDLGGTRCTTPPPAPPSR